VVIDGFLQLRGRAGRQGDPGSTRFMISLQDEMFRKFNTEWANSIVLKLGLEENVPLEYGSLAKQLLALQTAAERYYFGIRKSLVEFDEVMEVMLVVYSLYHGMGLP
jgi:preprotein translocase subunit SecA